MTLAATKDPKIAGLPTIKTLVIEEAAAMHKYIFYIAFLLFGCGSDGGSVDPGVPPVQGQHIPEVTALALFPNTVDYMEGDGSVLVTAEVSFEDAGLDIQTLWIRMPDGADVSFAQSQASETGKFTADFVMSTAVIGAHTVEFWLADKAGDSSVHRAADFGVVGDVQGGDWTSRLSGLPYALNDVIWDGAAFIAVGNDGAVLTSFDGTAWSTRDSGTGANLNAVAAYGSEIFVVGDETVLLSTDHGASWVMKDTFNAANLTAVVVTPSQVVVGGFSGGLAAALISISEDGGETWQAVDSWPAHAYFCTDLIYRDGLFVAATDSSTSSNGAKVKVSSDGKTWHDILVRDDTVGLYAVVHDGNQFIVAGGDSAVFTSFDGFNWTERQTPVQDIDYLSATWDGSRLVLAGGISWWYWWGGTTPPFERPVGIASTDGGENWDIFDIDGHFESRGIAWGNGRLVSVGQSTPISGEGAIYTTG